MPVEFDFEAYKERVKMAVKAGSMPVGTAIRVLMNTLGYTKKAAEKLVDKWRG